MSNTDPLFQAICKGDRNTVKDLVQKTVAEGGDIVALLNGSMIPAMREVGDRFSRNEAYVPEMLIAARAMQTGLDIIEPMLAERGHEPRGRIAIGTVKGDLHDIGKNLVGMMLKGAGYEVNDVGADCSIEKFEQAIEEGSTVVCLSALLTTTMPYMKTVVEHFRDRADVKVVLGGAPVTQDYADEVGADGYGADANEAVKVVERCLEPSA